MLTDLALAASIKLLCRLTCGGFSAESACGVRPPLTPSRSCVATCGYRLTSTWLSEAWHARTIGLPSF